MVLASRMASKKGGRRKSMDVRDSLTRARLAVDEFMEEKESKQNHRSWDSIHSLIRNDVSVRGGWFREALSRDRYKTHSKLCLLRIAIKSPTRQTM